MATEKTPDKFAEKTTEKPTDKAAEKSAPPVAKSRAAATPQSDEPVEPPPPVLTSLLPSSAAVGDPSFSLHLVGSGFGPTSVIVLAGYEERTTFVSENELSTIWNMPLWLGADPAISVLVRTGALETQTLLFNLLPPREVPLDPAYSSKPTPAIHQI